MRNIKRKKLGAILFPSFLFLQLIVSACGEDKNQAKMPVISYEIVDVNQIDEGRKQLHIEATLRIGYEAVLNEILENTGELPDLAELQLYSKRIISSTQLVTPSDGERYKLLYIEKIMKPQEHEGDQYYYLLFSIPEKENSIELSCYDPLIGLIKEEKSL